MPKTTLSSNSRKLRQPRFESFETIDVLSIFKMNEYTYLMYVNTCAFVGITYFMAGTLALQEKAPRELW